MQANKIAPIAAALLFLGTAAAASQATVPTVPLPGAAVRQTFLGELADLYAPGLRSELDHIEPLLSSQEVTSPAALMDRVDLVHGAYADAATAKQALTATASLAGLPVQATATPAPGPLTSEILTMYGLLGAAPTPQQVLDLKSSVGTLSADRALGLSILVSAVNQALTLQANGGSAYQAALGMLDAADAAKSLLSPKTTVSADCGTPFEDPLQLIWLGTPCNDTVSAQPARALQYDPAGDDTYYDNAGGAGGAPTIGGGFIIAGLTSDRALLEVLDNITLGGFYHDIQNETYQNNIIDNLTLANFPDNLLETINNVIGSVPPTIGFLNEFIAGLHPILETHPELVRQSVPVALHIDESGNDVYDSANSGLGYDQGAAYEGDLGVLLDRDGTDSYTCVHTCQGYGITGLGLLIDEKGSDSYQAKDHAQGSGDGGLLFELAGDDTYNVDANSAQGSTFSTALPRVGPTVLLDRSGADHYTAGGPVAQGAGAVLVDLSGNDVYAQTGSLQGNAQGVGTPQSVGMLIDGAGDDLYSSRGQAQGVGFGAPGVLADLAGTDAYHTDGAGQGFSRSVGSVGLLVDIGGDDSYTAKTGQGVGTEGGVAALIDVAGDDTYTTTGSGQGASLGGPGGPLGLLLDAAGSDSYSAGDNSQGSGASGQGAGILVDLKGADTFTAGSFSQGSGGEGSGVGILVDGMPEHTEFGPVSVVAQVNPESPSPDHYSAGDWSQGSSGPEKGGVGLLLDREHNSGLRNTFVAGDHSQGSATGQGVGVLASNNGKDDYTAGSFSQGASLGGVGLLVDQLGNDRYYPSDVATSHGFGDGSGYGTSAAIAVGLLLDDGGHDDHPDIGNNECLNKGDIGLAVDAEGANIPGDCLGDAAAAIAQALNDAPPELVQFIMDFIFGFPIVPPTGTVYFYDGMENETVSAGLWDVNNTGSDSAGCFGLGDPDEIASGWRIRDQTDDRQVAGPNAHTGAKYWFAGRAVGDGYGSCTLATLTTTTISLTNATSPLLTYWYAGASESCCDKLKVDLLDLTAGTTTHLATYSGDPVNDADPDLAAPAYGKATFSLAAHAGHDVKVVYTFESDSSEELGQGWNVDDVVVNE
jgi:hypothetical protein